MPEKADGSKTKRKGAYLEKVISLLSQYQQILIVTADNVGSSHMQTIRKVLRGKAVLLMGKNTMIRKALKGLIAKNPDLEALLPHVKGNIGFVFSAGDLNEIRIAVSENRVAAPAKIGSVAPQDVTIPKGPTGFDPQQTCFMQALNIATKINRGQIEIINDVHLLKAGDKVDSSKALLLQKLGIKPFSYGLNVVKVYDNGSVYSPSVLDLSDNDIVGKFLVGVQQIAALSLQINFPTAAAIPHYFANAYKNVLAISVETEYTFKQSEKVKAYLSDPSAFASVVTPATTSAASNVEAAPVAQEEEKKPEPEEEEEADMGFDLFGGGDDF